jgi:hypothetical protein
LLLSGPPSLLIVVQPGIEVNPVVEAAATEADDRNMQLVEERQADAQVLRGLLLSEAAHDGTWKGGGLHERTRVMATPLSTIGVASQTRSGVLSRGQA